MRTDGNDPQEAEVVWIGYHTLLAEVEAWLADQVLLDRWSVTFDLDAHDMIVDKPGEKEPVSLLLLIEREWPWANRRIAERVARHFTAENRRQKRTQEAGETPVTRKFPKITRESLKARRESGTWAP